MQINIISSRFQRIRVMGRRDFVHAQTPTAFSCSLLHLGITLDGMRRCKSVDTEKDSSNEDLHFVWALSRSISESKCECVVIYLGKIETDWTC